MPNGDALNDELEFKEYIKHMTADERSIFTAEKVFDLNERMSRVEGRVGILVESAAKAGTRSGAKTGTLSGGVTSAVVAGIFWLIEMLRKGS